MCGSSAGKIINSIVGGVSGGGLDFLNGITDAVTKPIKEVKPPKMSVPHLDLKGGVERIGKELEKGAQQGVKEIEKVGEDIKTGLVDPVLAGVAKPVQEFGDAIIEGAGAGVYAGSDNGEFIDDDTAAGLAEIAEAVPSANGSDSYGNTETDEDETDAVPNLEDMLGKLAAGRRTQNEGRGIGANILTSGRGVGSRANTRRRTLLG